METYVDPIGENVRNDLSVGERSGFRLEKLNEEQMGFEGKKAGKHDFVRRIFVKEGQGCIKRMQ